MLLRLAWGRSWRTRPTKFRGPPLFEPSLKVQGHNAHNRNSGFAVLPLCEDLNAHRVRKVPRGISGGCPFASLASRDRPAALTASKSRYWPVSTPISASTPTSGRLPVTASSGRSAVAGLLPPLTTWKISSSDFRRLNVSAIWSTNSRWLKNLPKLAPQPSCCAISNVCNPDAYCPAHSVAGRSARPVLHRRFRQRAVVGSGSSSRRCLFLTFPLESSAERPRSKTFRLV